MVITESASKKIQLIRGIAIIAVVLIHNTPPGFAQVWCRPFVNFAVGYFLFVSGLLSNRKRWYPLKRIKKVIMPYFIWSFIYVLFYNRENPSQIFRVFIIQLVTGKSAPIMYYIFVYCELTLLIPIIDKLARTRVRWMGFAIAPLEIIVLRLIPILLGLSVNTHLATIMNISCLGWFTYYYLGYLIGNEIITISFPIPRIIVLWGVSIILQIIEGYWYFEMGVSNCGTQLKLTAILSGVLFVLLAYKFIVSSWCPKNVLLNLLGNYSFGIFFIHVLVMELLNMIPCYTEYVSYPINATITVMLSLVAVLVGNKVFGKKRSYIAL